MTNVTKLSSLLAWSLLVACGQGNDTPAPGSAQSLGAGGHLAGAGGSAAGGNAATKGGSAGTGVTAAGGSSASGGSAGISGGSAGAGGAGGSTGGTGGGSGGTPVTAGTSGDDPGGSAGTSSGAAGASGGGAGGSGGSAGASGGSAGKGGGAGKGGMGGAAGASGGSAGNGGAGIGGAGSGGTAGTGATTTCTITAQATPSTAIPTVETVTWSTSQTGVTSAQIEFGPAAGGTVMVAPVDLTAPSYTTVLVGMKPSTGYVYRIKSTSSAGTCVSQDYPITTGALASAPKPTVTISDAAKHDKGFIVVSSGLGGTSAYIIDPDGTVVWVAPSSAVPSQPSRVHLSWDAKRLVSMSLNVQNSSAGKIQSVALDGTDVKLVSGVTASHHDFTAIPGGIATLLWNSSGIDAPCSLVEFPDSGTPKVIVSDMATIYTSNSFHTNAIHYYASDDTYTIGDRNPNLYAKVSHAGQLIWQFGGSNPKDVAKSFSGVVNWQVNHGHHLLPDGTFVFFNNGNGASSAAFVYKLNTQTMAATQTAKLTGVNSMVLGDAQALPNGNFLVTGSTSGTIQEMTSSGSVVMKITAPSGQQFGYSEFRESLYGPPPY